MKLTLILGLMTLTLISWVTTVSARYQETMDTNSFVQDLKSDYGLVDDDAKTNQSALLQKAINDVAAAGGGRLIIPKGTYRFAKVYLKSNVHLLIEKDTVIKPYWPEGTKTVIFILDKDAQVKTHEMMNIPEEYYDDLRLRKVTKFFDGPSIGAVKDYTNGTYRVDIENVTLEGFKYNADKKILTPEDARPGKCRIKSVEIYLDPAEQFKRAVWRFGNKDLSMGNLACHRGVPTIVHPQSDHIVSLTALPVGPEEALVFIGAHNVIADSVYAF